CHCRARGSDPARRNRSRLHPCRSQAGRADLEPAPTRTGADGRRVDCRLPPLAWRRVIRTGFRSGFPNALPAMSEYQYYEFQAIDRPLTADEMATLRHYSTRARITSTSFVNEYNWGDFKGDTDAWMAKFFDAFLYLANWGNRIFKLRLPSRLLPADTT